MLIDTHAHMQMSEFENDFTEVVNRCEQEKMIVVNIGTNYSDLNNVVNLASQYNWCYASLGIHPTEVFTKSFEKEIFTKLLNQKVVAMGEIGLDLWHLDSIKEEFNLNDQEILTKQIDYFEQQLVFAKENNLAVVVHGRNGHDENINVYKLILDILVAKKIERVVFHCFGGNSNDAKNIINKGYYLGFDGPITFKKNDALRDMISGLPIEFMLAETDCPFLAPEPMRGKRNEPVFVKHVINKLAEIKSISYQDAEDQLWENAKKLFRFTNY